MARRTAELGRGIEQAVAWTLRNLDGVVAMAAALIIGTLDILDQKIDSNVTSGAILLVLAALVFGTLTERRRRVVDIREAMSGTRHALEDLTMVRSLSGAELESALDRARLNTDRWVFKGGTGTYLRAVTLPVCVREAQRQRRSLTMKIDIVNPADEQACAAYARFRQTFAHRLHAVPAEAWSAERTRKESFATVLAACWYRQRLDTLEVDVYLSSVVPTLRFDLSSSCLIITQDDPQRVNLLVERDRPLYDYYVTELHQSREQAHTLDLSRTEPLSEEPTVDEVLRLFDRLALPLPAAFTDGDVGDIIDKALHAENPYRR
ncbi:hypothetical protein [Streptomyces griseocarneus]|uniref:hypothetical protein n=1 Tax=Streptomyces griseocarneus TaxID=51201 RepID=UPI00167EF59C|nr:hypothetical protein [Streptomyces griseocarneus]MBZ6474324.1 hypothetical protein [Streptomyces griseocarneus]GHG53316.1 hypothetical protein GCM10018779_15210 [Streptomyces griseocarneus]